MKETGVLSNVTMDMFQLETILCLLTKQQVGSHFTLSHLNQWAVYFVNANWFFVKFATNNNHSTSIHNTLLVFKFGYCQFCFTIENESSNWCTWQIKYSNVIV